MAHASIASKIFIQLLKKAKFGHIVLTLPDSSSSQYGEGDFVANVTVKDWKVIDTLINRGDIGLAEVIMEDSLQVDNMAALVEWACRNDHALAQALHGKFIGTFAFQIKKLFQKNTRSGAKKNIIAHYDLGNEFYRLWLDQTMSYSSALFTEAGQSLELAQQNKYDRLIERLDIRAEDHVLEIGCGWGGFFSRAVEKTGCKVTAVMNSPEQARHNRQLIQHKGFGQHIELKEIDYRDISGKFDKIVSIEMIEAVGEEYWDDYFAKVAASLKSKGKAIIQGITIQDDLFYSYRKSTDFIQTYIFPGGMLLTNSIIDKKSQQHDLDLSERFEFGQSYADTLKIWRDKFNEKKQDVKVMGFDDAFIRMWNLYLAYCEGAFRARRINVGQYLLEGRA